MDHLARNPLKRSLQALCIHNAVLRAHPLRSIHLRRIGQTSQVSAPAAKLLLNQQSLLASE